MTQEVGRHSVHSWQDDDVFSLFTVEDAHLTCSPGAGHYICTDKDTGEGVKQSVSARHKEGIHAGYPNPLVQPVDTHGRWGIVLVFIVCMCSYYIAKCCVFLCRVCYARS